jgi:hypothetical protein
LTDIRGLVYNNSYDSLTKEPVLVDWLTVLFLCLGVLGSASSERHAARETPQGVPIKKVLKIFNLKTKWQKKKNLPETSRT